MLNYEKPLEPYCDFWSEYGKNEFIMNKVMEICRNIAKNGASSQFEDIFDMIYIHIEENITDFYSEAVHEYSE